MNTKLIWTLPVKNSSEEELKISSLRGEICVFGIPRTVKPREKRQFKKEEKFHSVFNSRMTEIRN